jgi:hypothetical protein
MLRRDSASRAVRARLATMFLVSRALHCLSLLLKATRAVSWVETPPYRNPADLIIAREDRETLDTLRKGLLGRFDGRHVPRRDAGLFGLRNPWRSRGWLRLLSQIHFAQDVEFPLALYVRELSVWGMLWRG